MSATETATRDAALSSDRHLDGPLVRGLAWTGGARWATQIFTWASTLVVARILTPEDYGLMAMAAVFIGITTLLSEFGLGASVIVLRSLDQGQIAQLNGMALVSGGTAFLLSLAAAKPLGLFFHSPQLPAVVMVMGTTFIISAFRTIPTALMTRDLRFRELAIIDTIAALTLAIAVVAFALAGFRYWALVLSAILSTAAGVVATLSRCRSSFAWPRLASIRKPVTFSSDVVVSRISWYMYSNADFLVAGRMLGRSLLGAYSMAWTLASVPVEKITGFVMRVTPAFFAAVQTDLPAVRRYLIVLTEGISLIVFPAALGMVLVADDFVLTILGAKWAAAVAPLQILASYAAIRAVTPLLPAVLTAMGRARTVMWANLLGLLLLPAAFVLGSRWGTAGIATAWVVAHPIISILMGQQALRLIELPALRYLKSFWPAFSGVLIMAGVVLVVRTLFPPHLDASLRLAAQVAAGAAAYAGILLRFHRSKFDGFRQAVRHLKPASRECV